MQYNVARGYGGFGFSFNCLKTNMERSNADFPEVQQRIAGLAFERSANKQLQQGCLAIVIMRMQVRQWVDVIMKYSCQNKNYISLISMRYWEI